MPPFQVRDGVEAIRAIKSDSASAAVLVLDGYREDPILLVEVLLRLLGKLEMKPSPPLGPNPPHGGEAGVGVAARPIGGGIVWAIG